MLDRDNRAVPVAMGSHGIGIGRAVAAVAEATHDAKGLCWPAAVAPARVHVVVGRGDEHREAGEGLAAAADAAGLDVLLDDRAEACPGVKLTDAELLGMPTLVVVGRGLAPARSSGSTGHRRPRRGAGDAPLLGRLSLASRAPLRASVEPSAVVSQATGW